ncbi:hypothetical protein R5R35_011095 [Gryllus longicercus]|uniref:Kynurenine 3-monooxygenase n=1 Tax=Gryllus longicercus TaxID=2509291 RepID=A0AAN9ZD55_9ORTH
MAAAGGVRAGPAPAPAKRLKVAVVGGGLVGALEAVFLARRGHLVDLYEYRDDVRRTPHLNRGRTINLTLSHRGRAALRAAGLEAAVMARGLPVRGRLVHARDGTRARSLYHPDGQQCIYSVNRKNLNELLLTAAEELPNVRLHFNHKLVSADLDSGRLTFQTPLCPEGVSHSAALVVGADGAHSRVRAAMLRRPGFDFRQSNIEHAYLELRIPPNPDGSSALEPVDFLHVWPRGSFMLMALPNGDASWTVTLFAPDERLRRLCAEPVLAVRLFQTHLDDALHLIGAPALERDFAAGRPSLLLGVKCNPYHVEGKAIIIGDAAHAMVPFYGQGMNAGFEDCLLLDRLMNHYGDDLQSALAEFSLVRNPDAEAICDLAMYNYTEMRELVAKKSYHFRKKLDGMLYNFLPNLWVPLYPSVAFTSQGYRWCLENKQWQDKILQLFAITSISTIIIILGLTVLWIWNFISNEDLSDL